MDSARLQIVDHPYQPAASDDLRHDLEPGPYARESLLIDARLGGQWSLSVYTWVDGGGSAGYSLSVFGPAAGERAVFAAVDGVAVARSADFDDWRVGSLHLRVLEPLHTAQLSVRDADLQLELDFSAVHPAYSYAKAHTDPYLACPPFLATDRFEQAGRVSGTLTMHGRSYAFDGLGHRDHSWGQRDWEMIQHYRWVEAQAGDIALNVLTMQAQGRAWTMGYVAKAGILAPLESARVDVGFDDRWVQDRVELTLLDRLSRETTVHTSRYGRHETPVGRNTKLVDTAVTVAVEGFTGTGYVDLSWPRDYLRHLRAGPAPHPCAGR